MSTFYTYLNQRGPDTTERILEKRKEFRAYFKKSPNEAKQDSTASTPVTTPVTTPARFYTQSPGMFTFAQIVTRNTGIEKEKENYSENTAVTTLDSQTF